MIGVCLTDLAHADNEPDCSSGAGTSCSTFERERIKRWMKINKTKTKLADSTLKENEMKVKLDKVKTENSTESTEYSQRLMLHLVSEFKIVKSSKLLSCQNKRKSLVVMIGCGSAKDCKGNLGI